MRFSDPHWLLAGLLTGILLIVIWRRYDTWQQAALAKFIAAHLRLTLTGSVSRFGRFMQRGLFLGSALCLFAALAGPELGYQCRSIWTNDMNHDGKPDLQRQQARCIVQQAFAL